MHEEVSQFTDLAKNQFQVKKTNRFKRQVSAFHMHEGLDPMSTMRQPRKGVMNMTEHSILSTLEPSYLLNSTLNPDVNVAATTTAEAFSQPTSI